MNPESIQESLDQPALSIEDVRRLVENVLGYACNPGQLWLLFLDRDRRPLKTLMPIEQIPALPDAYMIDIALRTLTAAVGPDTFRWLVFALERWGPTGITGADRRWASVLADRSAAAGLEVAGMVLCTPQSVRTLPLSRPLEESKRP